MDTGKQKESQWPIVLITGTSSGIGLELVKILLKRPYRIVATSLEHSLENFKQENLTSNDRLWIYPLDITDLESISHMVQSIKNKWGTVDILINNAGISYRSTVEEMTAEDEQRQMTTNYLGPLHLIREVLPSMREKRAGRIVNISSVGGMMAMPTMASYSASKFALEGASEALWYEMKPWGIHTTLVQPGFINSLAFKKVFFPQNQSTNPATSPYEAYYDNMTRFVERLMTLSPSTSQSVAKKIARIIESKKPPLRTPGTWDAWLFTYMRRLIPCYFYHKILYQSLPGKRHWGPSKNQ